jgi:23S rRNA (cytidine1920-2'-O)/16S rRNA (cytidine1409-2'-O)-methyltransferase
MKNPRLDQALVQRGLVATRSQAENYIKLGYVSVDGMIVDKPGHPVSVSSQIKLNLKEQYVSRAALKLAGVADKLSLNFKDKTVLDVGSSTGGFTDYALRHGAKKVIAVDVGTQQLHLRLRNDSRVELYENTDIRQIENLGENPDIVLADVSFISLRAVLPHIKSLVGPTAQIAVLVKPQFEAGEKDVNKGIVKNDAIRRGILKNFEEWTKAAFLIKAKADSPISGAKGNQERFYVLYPKK